MASNGIKLAQAYVQIVPSAEGLGKSIKAEFESAGDEAGAAGGKKAGSAFASALGTAGKIAGAAVTAAAAAVGSIVKSAVSGFAEYEQLVGGVETLFKDSADAVQQYAANAYKTAGLSANEYMETVTSFSASLLQSLDGDTSAAAEYANTAITDMSDNANKMGTSMESIQNAYQGFAKQNYTMLDNLKLGYGGTKEEMERLLADASELSGIEYDITSYADIVDAIHVVQTEMGITGTTAKEASTTISGSLSSMKAAWQNLLVGMADGSQDIGPLIDNLVESALTFGENLVPVIEQALTGVGAVVTGLAPIIVDMLPGLVESILPGLLDSAMSIVESLVAALPGLLQTIIAALVGMLPQIVNAGIQLFVGLIGALPEIIDTIVAALPEIITGITSALVDNYPALVEAGVQLFMALVQDIPAIVAGIQEAEEQIIMDLATSIGEYLVQISTAIWEWFSTSVLEPVTQFLADLWAKITEFFAPLIEFISPLLESLSYLFSTIWTAITIVVSDAMAAISETVSSIWTSIKDFISTNILEPIKTAVSDAFNALVDLISAPLNTASSTVSSIFETIKSTISGVVESAKTWGQDLISNFVSGLQEKIQNVSSTITGIADTIRSLIGFSEPEVGPLSNFHTFAPDMMELFAQGIRENIGLVEDATHEVASATSAGLATARPISTSATAGNAATSEQQIGKAIADALRGVRVYIDGDRMVGYLVSPIDNALGVRQNAALRGAI